MAGRGDGGARRWLQAVAEEERSQKRGVGREDA